MTRSVPLPSQTRPADAHDAGLELHVANNGIVFYLLNHRSWGAADFLPSSSKRMADTLPDPLKRANSMNLKLAMKALPCRHLSPMPSNQ